jgi:hypothetical protein
MRIIIGILAILAPGFAQGRLNPVGNGGNILHPGIPAAGGPGTGTGRFGSGGQRFTGGSRGSGFGRPRTLLVPYPVAIDPFYSSYAGAGFYPPPGYYPGPGDYAEQPPSPAVVVNPNFQQDTIRPVLRDYSNVQLPDPTFKQVVGPPDAAAAGNDRATIYLIARKDHTIIPVLGYWMEKGALSYVTVDSVIGHVPLDQVDREFSQHLNDERHVEFQLPSGN